MAKQPQVLNIEPSNELRFRGPFTKAVTSYITLTNPTDKKVCFKIKTTAPKKYCVRPNSGVLEPNNKAEIAVNLLPFDFDPNEKNKHKFMVLTMIPPDGANYDNVWQDVNPDNLMDSKLKCVFEWPVENNENTDSATDEFTVQEKVKKAEVKSSSKQPSTEYSSDSAKVSSDIKNLKMEESHLRQENLELKEEIMRLKLSMKKEAETVRNPSKFGQQESNPSKKIIFLVLALVMGVVGYVLGKSIN